MNSVLRNSISVLPGHPAKPRNRRHAAGLFAPSRTLGGLLRPRPEHVYQIPPFPAEQISRGLPAETLTGSSRKENVIGLRIILARHSITDWNVGEKYLGRSDIPLNRAGFALAEKLADFL